MKGFETTRTLQGRVKGIPLKLKCEPITIKEPYKPEVKEFADTEEFTRYFRTNEELFKEPRTSEDIASTPDGESARREPKFLTTNKLNRAYKIPGYRIRIINKGKENEELTLVKDYYTRTSESNQETIIDTDNENNERITQLEELVQRITEQINNIETFLCQLKR